MKEQSPEVYNTFSNQKVRENLNNQGVAGGTAQFGLDRVPPYG